MTEKTVERRKLNGDKVQVSTWVMVVTYILCWSFAVALIVLELTGYLVYRPLLLALAVYLLLWPVFQTNPADLIRKVFPG